MKARRLLLMKSQEGLQWETNSLSLRSGESQGEGGGIPDRFQAMFSRLSPLPGPIAVELRDDTVEKAKSSPSPPAAGGEGRGEEGHFCSNFPSLQPSPARPSRGGRRFTLAASPNLVAGRRLAGDNSKQRGKSIAFSSLGRYTAGVTRMNLIGKSAGEREYVHGFSAVATSRCDVHAACSGAAPSNASVVRLFVPPATTRAGTARRAVPTLALNRYEY